MSTPKVIVELSGNHGGSLEHCVTLIRAAKSLKPTAIKLQCFEPDKLALKRLKDMTVLRALNLRAAAPEQVYEALLALYKKVHTPKEWWPKIIEELGGYPWSCSVFSPDDLSFVLRWGCPALKVASFELYDTQLIGACAATGLPLTFSVNYSASEGALHSALMAAVGSERITVLHASSYATPFTDAVEDAAKEIDRYLWVCEHVPPYADVGLSDHSPPGTTALLKAVLEKDADMVERHLCLADVRTPDSEFSDNTMQLRTYIDRARGRHVRKKRKTKIAAAAR